MGFFFFEGNNWEKVRRKVMVVLHDLCTWKIYAREVFVLQKIVAYKWKAVVYLSADTVIFDYA